MYEGALLLVADISCNYRDSPYKGEWGRDNDGRPSSSLEHAAAAVVPGHQDVPHLAGFGRVGSDVNIPMITNCVLLMNTQ